MGCQGDIYDIRLYCTAIYLLSSCCLLNGRHVFTAILPGARLPQWIKFWQQKKTSRRLRLVITGEVPKYEKRWRGVTSTFWKAGWWSEILAELFVFLVILISGGAAGIPLVHSGRHMRVMPAENWQNTVLFLVSFMHVWYVDKEMEQNTRNCPP